MNNIAAVRTAKKLTQKALGEAAGVSQPYIHDLERGARGAKQETLERIAEALGVTVDELIGKGEEQ